jgi:hypothetical protein
MTGGKTPHLGKILFQAGLELCKEPLGLDLQIGMPVLFIGRRRHILPALKGGSQTNIKTKRKHAKLERYA